MKLRRSLMLRAIVVALAARSVAAVELEPVVSGLTSPLYVTSARDGTGRLFVVERPGHVLVLQPGAAEPALFLDISAAVLSGGERGLLGLAFHPDFAGNRRLFVDYTRRPDGATVIAEYHASAFDPDVADPAETVLLTIPQPFDNHNGGMVEFGADGFLYVAMGDGGGGNDPDNRAQDPEDLLGKILRLDVDHPDGAVPYSSPPDNPFFGETAGRDEIYALGLRNPFRFSFDRATGELWVGDVGQGEREEIDLVTRGGNYGWRVYEGTACTGNDPLLCGGSGFTFPIAEYGHTAGRCALVGGYVYRGVRATLPAGAYVFGDYCTGEILMLRQGIQSLLLDTNLNISSFGEDEAGELYVVDLGGLVQRLADHPDARCPAPVPLARPRLTLGGLATPPGDDTLLARGELTLPSPFDPVLDPLTNGVRLLIDDARQGVLDVTLPGGAFAEPPGAGWKVDARGTTWTWADRGSAPPGGITAATIRDRSTRTPGLVKFSVRGRGGSYPVAAVDLPLTIALVLDPATPSQCGRASFAGPRPAPSCTLGASGRTLTCR